MEKFVGLHLPEHADAADGVAHLARDVIDRRGDRAQTDLVFAVLDGVALVADAAELRRELLGCGEGVRRKGLQLRVRQNAAAFGRGDVGKEELALRGAVDRQARADLGDDAQTRAGLLLRERHDRGAVKNGQEDALAKLIADGLHVRPGDRADIPRI